MNDRMNPVAHHAHSPHQVTRKGVLAQFVTTETGTGAVHIAPGHGAEDYFLGQRNDLEVYSPVRDDGTFDDTVPELVESRERDVIVVCRSGNRSAFAAATLQQMGYRKVYSMKTGLRGWNDYELPLVTAAGKTVPVEQADEFFTSRLRPEQLGPKQQQQQGQM